MSALVGRFWMPLAALLALTYLVAMLLSGALPERRQLIHAEANGVLRQAPESITRGDRPRQVLLIDSGLVNGGRKLFLRHPQIGDRKPEQRAEKLNIYPRLFQGHQTLDLNLFRHLMRGGLPARPIPPFGFGMVLGR